MSSTTQWIPVLLPKEVVSKLLKEYIIPQKEEISYMKTLKNLQKKVKKVKLFRGMNQDQITRKLHKERRMLLKENPHAYIDYSA